jgi:hypothetical protein
MVEPLFAPVSQFWPAMPAPAFGVVQAPMASAHRPYGTIMSTGMPTQGPPSSGAWSTAPASNPMPLDPYAFAGGPAATTVPALTTSEIAIGVTASALLTAVAMRRGQPLGPTNDQEIEDFISDAFDLLPGTNDVEVRVEGGRATLTGSVPHKRLKRDVGEIAWTIPTLNDVHNNVTVTQRRRSRTSREGESPVVAGRKQT